MTPSDAVVSWTWTLNGNTVSYAPTFTIPTTAKEGDIITVSVTNVDGTASDSVIVGATTELALESVEGAAESGGRYNVLIAYFNQPVDDIVAGDIQIRRVADDQLFAVESVSLSSDGMKATITLANTNAAGAVVTGLDSNVDYNMIVTSEDGTASKEFYIPAVLSDVSVLGIAPSTSKITIADPQGAAAYTAVTLTVPEDMDVDYEYLLGRTVTVKYDKSNLITSLTIYDEDVVYGAFKVNNTAAAGDGNIEDLLTGEKYTSQAFVTVDSAIHTTVRLNRAADGSVTTVAADGTTAVAINATPATDFDSAAVAYNNGTEIAYAKLVLNSNGTVKVMVTEPTWGTATNNILVSAVHGTTVLGGTTEISLKNYVIVEDGFTIDVSDIDEGDVVFYNTTHKFAEVYTVSETDELEAVYNNRFTFGGKTYDEADAVGNITYQSRYIKSGSGLTAVDDDYMSALKASDEDITVYFDRAGQPVYVTGTLGEVKTTSVSVVLTADTKTYTQSLVDYLRIKGYNGTEIKTYDIDISKLQTVTLANGTTHKKGYADQAKGAAAPAANAGSGGFVAKAGGAWSAAAGTGVLQHKASTAAYNSGTNVDLLTAGTTLVETSFVTLTLNDKDQVIGINFEDMDATGFTNNAGTAIAQAAEPMTAAANLTPGLTKVTTASGTYQLSGSTKVYICDRTDHKVRTINYEDYTSSIACGKVGVVSYNNKDVTALFVTEDSIAGNNDGSTTIEAVVANVEHNPGTDNYMTELTLVYGNGGSADTDAYTTEYTKFAVNTIDTLKTIAKGDIVTVVIAADGETINSVTENTVVGTDISSAAEVNIESNENKTFTAIPTGTDAGVKAGLAFATASPATVVEFANGAVTCLDWATFVTETEKYKVIYSMLGASTAYVDTLVVTTATARTNTPAAYAAGKAAVDAATFGAVSTNATSATQTAAFTDASGLCTVTFSSSDATKGTAAIVYSDATLGKGSGTITFTGLDAGSPVITITVSSGGYFKTYTTTLTATNDPYITAATAITAV